ncbi:Rpp20 subunit of nuclear RNase MRP and P-domain-containing protein [Clohesyomyces aquaticus]|uniref:Rpp20 subunit of nuclear RNase MRP and P-domain-containing protein n=1 Tax=Clohesyomyces aquaticus TaxID=1231657 RepID=A0A1Y2ABP8_9PLEO|nr:Rpp20 subunit of nuclear RNase MRP and P-domain-containing protein [Clohesyomyces aquaticus]
MLSAVGLGANRLRPAKFAFSFTPPSNAPQMPPIEPITPSKAPNMVEEGAQPKVQAADTPMKEESTRKRNIKEFGPSAKKLARWEQKRQARPHGKDEPYQKPGPKIKTALKATEDIATETTGEPVEAEEEKASENELQQTSAPEGPSRKRQRKGNQEGAKNPPKNEPEGSPKGNQGKKPQKTQPTPKQQKQKPPRLPTNAVVSKRPLLHPATPSPFASSSSQKVVYVNASAPFVSKVKQVRKLLEEVSKRQKQSLTATGSLNPKAVELAIADASNAQPAAKEAEAVYLKATGKAIPTALNIGLFFQNQSDYKIKIEIGEVSAIDDINLRNSQGEPVPEDLKEEAAAVAAAEADVDAAQADVSAEQQTEAKPEPEVKQEKGNRKKNKKRKFAEEVPETRIRTLSAVTVAISFK